MAMAGARTEVASLLRALMERLDIVQPELLTAHVDKLVSAIRPPREHDESEVVRVSRHTF